MQIAVFFFFGWSVLWVLPLLARLTGGLLGIGPGARGRGSIRLWLGTLLILCASSTLEAMLRGQPATGPAPDAFGHWLAGGLTQLAGGFISALLLLAAMALGLFWLFSRPGARTEEEDDVAPRSAPALGEPLLPRRTLSAEPPPARSNPGSLRAATTPPPRKHQSWTLPPPIPPQETVAGRRHAQPPAATEKPPTRPTPRAPSAWDAVESLRPTEAMLARARAEELAARRERERREAAAPVLSRVRLAKAGCPAYAHAAGLNRNRHYDNGHSNRPGRAGRGRNHRQQPVSPTGLWRSDRQQRVPAPWLHGRGIASRLAHPADAGTGDSRHRQQ
jgi:S-DNA-T family DNA segregation ATPase FtsK/SpoIIIE